MIKNEKKVAIYIRTANGGENAIPSIIKQLSNINRYVIANNITLKKEYYIDEGFSGTTFDRPAFNRLTKDIKDESINLILVDSISRFSRDTSIFNFYKYISKHKINFISVSENFDMNKGQQFRTVMMKTMDEWYKADLLAKRHQRKDRIR